MLIPGDAPRSVELMTPAPAPAPAQAPATSTAVARPSPSSSSHAAPTMTTMQRRRTRPRIPLPALKKWSTKRIFRSAELGGSGDDARDRDGFEQIRVKLMVHFRQAVDRIVLPAAVPGEVDQKKRASAAKNEREKEEGDAVAATEESIAAPAPVSATAAPAAVAAAKSPLATAPVPIQPMPAEELPWNLRTRRGASNGRHLPNPPVDVAAAAAKSIRPRSGDPDKLEERQKKPRQRRRPSFSVSLSKEEIEEDLYAVTGRRASGRPRKRPRAVQKQLDLLFPGLWLLEAKPELYQVPDDPPPPLLLDPSAKNSNKQAGRG